MKIGLMLRTMGDRQGIGIYTENLVDHMLPMDADNEFVLFYSDPKWIGRYAHYPNIKEIVVSARNKMLWDQWKIPLAIHREQIDVVFHTKFTVPLLNSVKCVMSVHGASWFIHPELYAQNKVDLNYIRLVMPLYCRKATAIVSNSDITTNDYIRILKVEPKKIKTIHLAPNTNFRKIGNQSELENVKKQYILPDRFLVSVIRYDPRKNFKNLIEAYRLAHPHIDCKLVILGLGCQQYKKDYDLEKTNYGGDVLFFDWVEQQDLPAFYNLSSGLFFPSVYEEFGIPVTEAMACGCPVVVSNTGALPELVGDAGILVDPMNPIDMADGLKKLLTVPGKNKMYSQKVMERSKEFSWDRCARETLEVIHQVGNGTHPAMQH
jgi:glycosyltransferase involved in cell wall biosynthesis